MIIDWDKLWKQIAIFGAVIFFIGVFFLILSQVANAQERLKDYDIVRKNYFKVVIEGDTVEQGFSNFYTAEQYLRNYADTVKVNSKGTEIVGMNFYFRPNYEPIDEGTLQSLLLKDVNWQHSQHIGSENYDIRMVAYSIADSVKFAYTGFDSTGLILNTTHTKIPVNRAVHDTLTTDHKGNIQVEIEAYYGTEFTEETLLIDMGFISSLPDTLKKKTIP